METNMTYDFLLNELYSKLESIQPKKNNPEFLQSIYFASTVFESFRKYVRNPDTHFNFIVPHNFTPFPDQHNQELPEPMILWEKNFLKKRDSYKKRQINNLLYFLTNDFQHQMNTFYFDDMELASKQLQQSFSINQLMDSEGRLKSDIGRYAFNEIVDGEGKSPFKKKVFLSYAYEDKLYTLALYNHFLSNKIFLIVDWMIYGKSGCGRTIKQRLHCLLKEADYLLFLNSLHSELDIQGSLQVRQWCSWEIGEFHKTHIGKKNARIKCFPYTKDKNVSNIFLDDFISCNTLNQVITVT